MSTFAKSFRDEIERQAREEAKAAIDPFRRLFNAVALGT